MKLNIGSCFLISRLFSSVFLHVFVFSFLSPSRILPSRRPRYLAPAHHQETFGDFDPLHFELPKPFASDQPTVGTTATMSWAKGKTKGTK